MIKLFKRRKKKPTTYVEAHNRAFSIFTKASTIMIWAAVFNVFGVMLTIIQYAMNNELAAVFIKDSLLYGQMVSSTYQFSLCFSSNSFIFRLLEILNHSIYNSVPILETHWFYIAIIAIAIAFAGVVSYLSILTKNGKKWAMITNAVFYGVDTIMILGCYLIGEDISLLWISLGVHIIILFFIAVGIFEYFHLFEIEKTHDKQVTQNEEINEINIGE